MSPLISDNVTVMTDSSADFPAQNSQIRSSPFYFLGKETSEGVTKPVEGHAVALEIIKVR